MQELSSRLFKRPSWGCGNTFLLIYDSWSVAQILSNYIFHIKTISPSLAHQQVNKQNVGYYSSKTSKPEANFNVKAIDVLPETLHVSFRL